MIRSRLMTARITAIASIAPSEDVQDFVHLVKMTDIEGRSFSAEVRDLETIYRIGRFRPALVELDACPFSAAIGTLPTIERIRAI